MSLPAALAAATFPRPVLRALETLGRAGYRSWLVGGAVRDLLLHRPRAASDFDLATPATPAEVQRLFRKVIPTGVEHGTVTVVLEGTRLEVTTFRGEGAYVDGRRPSSVTFLPELEPDLARRDFTMNAIAYDPLARELRDPFAGQADLARRAIRAVGDPAARFAEDGLRPLRAVRFAAQLGFSLDAATERAIPGALGVTARVAAERVTDELSKLLLAPHAAEGLRLLDATGLLGVVLPDLAALPAARRAHGARAASLASPPGLPLRLAALLHPLGQGAAGALGRLRLAGEVSRAAAALVALQPCLLDGPAAPIATPPAARRWLARAGRPLAPSLLALWRAEVRALPGGAAAEEARRSLRAARRLLHRACAERSPLATDELALDGRAVMEALGTGPGPHVGRALRHLLEAVLEDPGRNERPSLEAALRAWWSTQGGGVR